MQYFYIIKAIKNDYFYQKFMVVYNILVFLRQNLII